jgi:predicted PurR-regulated permease PerM
MLAIGVIVIGALYFAREVFVPLALAVLLSFALGPLVLLLRRWHFGRVPSVLVAVVLAFIIIFSIGTLIGGQLAQLAENLPQYRTNVMDKIQSLRSATLGSGIVARASGMLKDLSNEFTKTTEAVPNKTVAKTPAPVPQDAEQKEPVPVVIRQPPSTPLQIVQIVVGPLLQPLATTGIVIVFVVFFLLQREDLRNRFIRLTGARDLRRTTEALDDAGRRVSSYLLMQTAINACFGVLIGAGLWLIGVPNPVLWGILAMLLRFVPYIGVPIAAAFPLALAFSVDPGWSTLLWTAGLFLVMEPITGQVVEPSLYGQSTGLSAVAVVVAAVFWTWLWGPIGLILSTPLTLCLLVLGRHVEQFEFLDVVLGDQPPLTLEESFYQRMLAADPDEAARQAEEFLKERPLSAYYDEVAIKGLALAQLDADRGALDHERCTRIKQAVDVVIDDLSDHTEVSPPSAKENLVEIEVPSQALSEEEIDSAWRRHTVLCIAGRGSLDEAAAAMLEQLLEQRGISGRVVSSEAVSAANIIRLDMMEVNIACLSHLEPSGFTNARYLIRRLRRKLPRVQILVGLWMLSEEDAKRSDALRETGADLVVTSLREAVEEIITAAKGIARQTEMPTGQCDVECATPLRIDPAKGPPAAR